MFRFEWMCCKHCGCEDEERIGHDDTCKYGCNDEGVTDHNYLCWHAPTKDCKGWDQ